MKRKIFVAAIALSMAGLATTANASLPIDKIVAIDEINMQDVSSDYKYVKHVTIYKQLGQASRNSKTPIAQQSVPVYKKDGKYYIKIPDFKKTVEVGKNNMYGRTDLDGLWHVDLQYHVCGWYFNI